MNSQHMRPVYRAARDMGQDLQDSPSWQNGFFWADKMGAAAKRAKSAERAEGYRFLEELGVKFGNMSLDCTELKDITDNIEGII